MKHSRKKRTPTIDLDKLKETSSQIHSEEEMSKLKAYFTLLEEMKTERILNTPFISMEALARITKANTEGYNGNDVLGTCHHAGGQLAGARDHGGVCGALCDTHDIGGMRGWIVNDPAAPFANVSRPR